MFTNKTTRMFCVFAVVAAATMEVVTAASMTASDSALALKVSSSYHSVSKGKTSNSNSSADSQNDNDITAYECKFAKRTSRRSRRAGKTNTRGVGRNRVEDVCNGTH